MKYDPLVMEQVYDAPVQQVWDALTKPELMQQWFFDIAAFEPVAGFSFSFTAGPPGKPYLHVCRVTQVEPGKKLAYSWRYEGYTGDSEVVFELFDEGGKTRVKLSHYGLETFDTSNPDLAPHNFAAGWTQILGTGLKNFVETGRIIEPVSIDATPVTVWNILTNTKYVHAWAAAFSPGTIVETDWHTGSTITWKDADGNIGASGIIGTMEPLRKLQLVYPADGAGGEIYKETFGLEAQAAGTLLHIDAGPLAVQYIQKHAPMWTEALQRIKQLAETGLNTG